MNEIITNTIAISQETEPNISQIGENLNGMDHEGRKQWMHSMGKKQMAKLFETSQISPLQSFFVPPQKNDLEEVIHHGKNSLPVSSFFQKRFARPTGQNPQDPKEVCGYNHQDLAWLTGPGYFILHRCDEGLSDSVIDYYLTPEQKCEHKV